MIVKLRKMKINSKYLTLLIASFFYLQVFSESVKFKGKVLFETKGTHPEYTVSAYSQSRKDSTLLAIRNFSSKEFQIEVISETNTIRLFFSSVGYHTIIMDYVLDGNVKSIDVGEIRLTEFSKQLKETVVVAKRPVTVKNVGWKSEIGVRGTDLATRGSLRDMFRNMPGVIMMNDRIVVPGVSSGGKVVILIDNREVQFDKILDIVRSNSIDNVEIDRSPSGEYSDASAVIRIKTIRKISDYIYLDVSTSFEQRHRPIVSPNVNFRLKSGILSSMVSYMYNYQNSHTQSGNYIEIIHPNYIFQNNSESRSSIYSRTPGSLIWSSDLDFKSNSRLNLTYYGTFQRNHSYTWADNTFSGQAYTVARNLYYDSSSKQDVHSFSSTYNYDFSKDTKLRLQGSYARVNSSTDYLTNETRPGSTYYKDVRTESSSYNNMYTTSGNFDFLLPGDIRSTMGVRFSDVYISTNNHTNDKDALVVGFTDNSILGERQYSTWFDLNKTWKKVIIQAGIKYEFSRMHASSHINGKVQTINRYFSDFMPNIKISYNLSSDWAFNLFCQRGVKRPSFGDITPGTVYKDSLSYTSGNPDIDVISGLDLKTEIRWKYLILSLAYQNIRNYYERGYVPLDNVSDILTSKLVKMQRLQSYGATVIYYYMKNRWSIYPSINVAFIPLYVSEQSYKLKFYTWSNLYVRYNITNNFSAYIQNTLESPMKMGLLDKKRYFYTVDAGVTLQLLKRRLILNVNASNIFRFRQSDAIYHFNNVHWGTRPIDPDYMFFNIGLTYKIFNREINVRKEQGNEDLLDRIK